MPIFLSELYYMKTKKKSINKMFPLVSIEPLDL